MLPRAHRRRRAPFSSAILEVLELRQLLSATFDNAFNGDGLVVGPAGAVSDTAVASNGDVVVLDHNRLLRYTSTGNLDPTFGGGDGIADLPFFGETLEIQGDGRIAVGGNAPLAFSANMALARFNADGTPDATFNGGEVLSIRGGFSLAWHSTINDLQVLSDGRIVATGDLIPRNNRSLNAQLTALRITTDGQLDRTFSHDGVESVAFNTSSDLNASSKGAALSVRPDGKLVVIGDIHHAAGHDAVAVRFNTDGFLDGSFGVNGVARLASEGITRDIETQFSNKALISAGSSVIRLNANGSMDSTFRRIDLIGVPQSETFMQDLEVTSEQEIIAAATLLNQITDGSTHAALHRYASDGRFTEGLDLRWGNADDDAIALELHDDRATIGGITRAFGSGNPRIALARLTLDGNTGGSDQSLPFDPAFGGDGTVAGPAGNVSDVALAPGGKAVVLSDNRLIRFQSSGGLDLSFGGGDGIADTLMLAETIEIQSDGKIIVGGSTGTMLHADMTLARFNADGSIDRSFGNNGTLVIGGGFSIEAFSRIADLEILADGRIVAAGNLVPRNNRSQNTQPAAVRVTPAGQLDQTFSHDGIASFDLGPSAFGVAQSLSVRSDGKLVVAGFVEESSDVDVVVARVNTDGSFDDSFGTNRIVIIEEGTTAPDVETQFNDKALLSIGHKVLRLTANGTIDPTFDQVSGEPGPNGGPYFADLEVVGGQEILIAATLSAAIADGSTVAYLFEHMADGRLESQTTLPWTRGAVAALEVQDGKAFLGGVNRPRDSSEPHTIALSRILLNSTGGGPGTGLAATYYDNDNFTNPKLTRIDSTVDFNWALGSPAASIAPDTFSVRWTGKITAPTSGAWTFYIPADDRAKLIINGVTVADYLPGKTPSTGTITLQAGASYDIALEYREFTGNARATLQWSGPGVTRRVVPTSALTPSAFTPGDTQAPTPPTNLRVTRTGHDNIQLAWNASTDNVSVAAYEISRNGQFIARSTFAGFTDVNLQPNTTYTYSVVAIDDAGNKSPTATITARTTASSGGGLQVTYFDNPDFTNPVENGISPTVNYNWGTGKASPFQTDADEFSVRWRGHIKIDRTGDYRFFLNTDNGARLWIDGRLVIDDLEPGRTVDLMTTIRLDAGRKSDIILEVIENTGNAHATLQWAPPDVNGRLDIPTSVLFPSLSGVPMVPTHVAAAKVTGGVRVTWGDVTGETGYTIQRRLESSQTWTPVGSVAADTTFFTDTGATTPGSYVYRVRADNRTFGSSQYALSNPVPI